MEIKIHGDSIDAMGLFAQRVKVYGLVKPELLKLVYDDLKVKRTNFYSGILVKNNLHHNLKDFCIHPNKKYDTLDMYINVLALVPTLERLKIAIETYCSGFTPEREANDE